MPRLPTRKTKISARIFEREAAMDTMQARNIPSYDEKNPPNLPIEARTTVLEHPSAKPSRNKPSANTRRIRRERKKKSASTKVNRKKNPGTFTNVSTTNTITSNGGNFDFVAPYKRIKFRRLAEADVDAFKRRGDIHGVLSYLDDVAYGDLGDYVEAPPAAVKAFKMSQYAIQYLLHTQDVLREGANQADLRREKALKKLENVKARLKLQRDERKTLNTELRRSKRVIKSHKSVLGAVSPEMADVDPENLDEEVRRGMGRRAVSELQEEANRLKEAIARQKLKIENEKERFKVEKQRQEDELLRHAAQEEDRRKAEEARALELKSKHIAEEEARHKQIQEEERAMHLAREKKLQEEERARLAELKRKHDEEEEARHKKLQEEEQAMHLAREKKLQEEERARLAELKRKHDEEEKARQLELQKKHDEEAAAAEKRKVEQEQKFQELMDKKKRQREEAQRKKAEREAELRKLNDSSSDEGKNSSSESKAEKATIDFDDNEEEYGDSFESIPMLDAESKTGKQQSPVEKPKSTLRDVVSEVPDDENKEDEIADIYLDRQRAEEEEKRNKEAEAAKFAMDEDFDDDSDIFEEGIDDLLPSGDLEADIRVTKAANTKARASGANPPELSRGDTKKYEKAFKKWDEDGEGTISSENVKDLLTTTLPGKLKWSSISDDQLEVLLSKMGASTSGDAVQISKSTFFSAMRFREGIESGEIVIAKKDKAGGDKDIQETLDLLDASSFGDDSWEDA